MRHIDMQELEELHDWPPGKQPDWKRSPEEWRKRLCKAEEELRKATDSTTRSAIFTKYSDLWSAVKEHYRALSRDKCWYCETSTHRMTGEIDHFRPKAGVEKISHSGYWWLGFDWHNWRFVCKFCNSETRDVETGIVGGKGNHFPLLCGEERRIWSECDYNNLIEEDPVLLDPANQRDPLLLTFSSNGLPGPTVGDEKSDDYRRAKESIRIYHLDNSRLVRERKKIYIRVRNFVADYQHYQQKWELEKDRSAQSFASKQMKELGRMITPKAEYSATARAYLKEYRKDDPQWAWVDQLLTAPS
jgi:uncharacterized protein (TIGR02646 family)